MASELRIHSDEAWNIASRYSHILASETRDLAAAIDVALQKARAEEVEKLRGGRVKALAKLDEIVHQVEINVQIAKRDHPEGVLVDGKRIDVLPHSQETLAGHVKDRAEELRAILSALSPEPVEPGEAEIEAACAAYWGEHWKRWPETRPKPPQLSTKASIRAAMRRALKAAGAA